jgi:hypothetical protein
MAGHPEASGTTPLVDLRPWAETDARPVPDHRAARPVHDQASLQPVPVPDLFALVEGADGGPVEVSRELAVILDIEEGRTTLFEAAIDAFYAGDFGQAESLFLEEATRALGAAPQRAAIAYRQAAMAAAKAGNVDASDHWMRLAGREYLRVSEADHTPLPFIRETALVAAKCFLSVGNLEVANKGLRRAQAIEAVLQADDNLAGSSTGIPFRYETALSAHDNRLILGADLKPVTVPTKHRMDGWVGRLRQLLPRRMAA